jgi:uncharacterized protein (DUF1015 family)
MIRISPFKAIRPVRDKVHLVATRPYYTYKKNILKAKLEENPYTFLRIINPEFNSERKTKPNSTERFVHVRDKYSEFIHSGILIQDSKPALYIYQQTKNGHQFTGVIAGASIQDYKDGKIKKHEATLTSREAMFVNYLDIVGYNAEPVLLSHPAHDDLEIALLKFMQVRPEYEFTTTDEIKHELWILNDDQTNEIQGHFDQIDALYIADGHHRSASSSGLLDLRRKSNKRHFGNEDFFLAFLMDERKMQILEFNRLVKHLNGLSKKEFLTEIDKLGALTKLNKALNPTHEHQITFYLENEWYALNIDKTLIPSNDPVKCLDTDLLTELILRPILGIQDLKTDPNISFVSGAESIDSIVSTVNSGKFEIAFILYPISIDQVKAVADANGIMPPKSTWVEPKLRSGLTIYNINE